MLKDQGALSEDTKAGHGLIPRIAGQQWTQWGRKEKPSQSWMRKEGKVEIVLREGFEGSVNMFKTYITKFSNK